MWKAITEYDHYNGPTCFTAYNTSEQYPRVYLFRWFDEQVVDGTDNRIFINDISDADDEQFTLRESDIDFTSMKY